jgi:hypothetical protein
MAFYKTPFGNGVLVGSGGNVVEDVRTQFGRRRTGGFEGVNKIEGMKEELIIYIDGEVWNDVPDTLKPFVLPAGAVIKNVYVDIEKAFNLTGTTPTILIGTDGSEVTNGFVISEAVAEGIASVNLTSTLVGTWAVNVPLAANTLVGIALGGTTPVMAGQGVARITIQFDRINRAPSPAKAGGPVLP